MSADLARSRPLAASLLALSLAASCNQHTSSSASQPSPAATPEAHADVVPADARTDASTASHVGPPIDPGSFERFGCNTDAIPPHIAAGTASVTWRPRRGSSFNFRNLPARCGAAYPGQIVEGARTRPGDGAEFVVCMPGERRLDVGVLRRAPVAAGAIDAAHTPNLIRLRIGLDRYINVTSPAGAPDPNARLLLGPRLRTASGSARVALNPGGEPDGVVEFEIRCAAPR